MSEERREEIIGKIRKLLAFDGATATEAEVENAVALAQKLMTEYAIEQADIEAAQGDSGEPEKARVDSDLGRSFLARWEVALHNAVLSAVPGVSCYRDFKFVRRFDSSGGSAKVAILRWYGDAELSEIARELFDETRSIIATMATGRYGNPYQGDGAQYATGFAHALFDKLKRAGKALDKASEVKAIVLRRDEENRAWLANTHGLKLGAPKSQASGKLKGDPDARREGYKDGQRFDMTPGAPKKKLAGSGRRALPGF